MSSDTEYLGNSISIEHHEGVIVMWSQKSDRNRSYVRMDKLVLRELLDWIDDNYRGELESAIERRELQP